MKKAKPLKYGPQTVEIEYALERLRDPKNKEVWDAVLSKSWVVPDWYIASDRALDAAQFAIRDAARDAVATSAYNDAKKTVDGVTRSIDALVIKDLIGIRFTQKHFDLLYKSLGDFLVIVDGTQPNSFLREVSISLLTSMTGHQAVNFAGLVLDADN